MKTAPSEATQLLMAQDPEFRRRVLELQAQKAAERRERAAARKAKAKADSAWLRRRNARRSAIQARERYAKTEKGQTARARAQARYLARLRYARALGELA